MQKAATAPTERSGAAAAARAAGVCAKFKSQGSEVIWSDEGAQNTKRTG